MTIAELIDSLEKKLFPFQESEEEQEAFTPEGRKRVTEWIREHFPETEKPESLGSYMLGRD